jgi:hypothetical protein
MSEIFLSILFGCGLLCLVAYSSVAVYITYPVGSKEVIQHDKLAIELSSNLQIYHLERGTVSHRDYCLLSVINPISFIHIVDMIYQFRFQQANVVTHKNDHKNEDSSLLGCYYTWSLDISFQNSKGF